MSVGELIQRTPEKSDAGSLPAAGNTDPRAVERDWRDKVKECASDTGVDWLEATKGEDISIEEYERLFNARVGLFDTSYATFSPGDILNVFKSWGKYQRHATSEFNKRAEQKQADKQELLDKICLEHRKGLLPYDFLWSIEKYTVKNPSTKGRPLDRLRLVYGQPAEPDVLISRYSDYRLIKYLFEKYPRQGADGIIHPIDDRRLMNIVLGFNTDNNKIGDNTLNGIRNSHESLSERAILGAIEDLDLYDHINPDSRQNHLDTLLDIARPDRPGLKPEYLFDRNHGRIVMLGKIALSEVEANEGQRYLEILHQVGKLVIDEEISKSGSNNVAVRTVLSKKTEENIELKNSKRGAYSEWEEDDYISYGEWLLAVLKLPGKPIEKTITKPILKSSYQLGLGPSVYTIVAQFGSLGQFYERINAKQN